MQQAKAREKRQEAGWGNRPSTAGAAAVAPNSPATRGNFKLTIEIPRALHRGLKRYAFDRETSMASLIIAALDQTYGKELRPGS